MDKIRYLVSEITGSREKMILNICGLVCHRSDRRKVEKIWSDFCK